MLLSHKTTVKLNKDAANVIGHMCYAAYKLWNVCNYERRNYKELGLAKYPDWYDQKSHYKDNMWYKSLPSQSAQEVCKLLDQAWKSFYALKKSGSIQNPNPPRYRQEGMPVTYMQNGLKHEQGSTSVRLSLSKRLKEHMKSAYGSCETYLFLENKIFRSMDHIKQIKLYPPDQAHICKVIVIYETEDVRILAENGHYLSVDCGLHNLMTCYDSNGKTFIVGRKYLEICRRYDKEIARVQSQWGKCQSKKGVRYPKRSKHQKKLYEKKKKSIQDYLHKITRYLVDYCERNAIHTVIMGDLTHVRQNADLGKKTNQKLHSLPYARLYGLVEYKLAQKGICMVKQKESWSSQCAPDTPEVSKEYAQKENRRKRGLYKSGKSVYNADAVGAYNILRKYMAECGQKTNLPMTGLSDPELIKVAV